MRHCPWIVKAKARHSASSSRRGTDTRVKARTDSLVKAQRGPKRRGAARTGEAARTMESSGPGSDGAARTGQESQGAALTGESRHGVERTGEPRRIEADQESARRGSPVAVPSSSQGTGAKARRGPESQGTARTGEPRRGVDGESKRGADRTGESTESHSADAAESPRTEMSSGTARIRESRQGAKKGIKARRGKVKELERRRLELRCGSLGATRWRTEESRTRQRPDRIVKVLPRALTETRGV